MTFWSTAARDFVGPKKEFLSLQMFISCNLHGKKFWNCFHIFEIEHTTRSYGYICPKMFFFNQKFATCPKNGSFGAFWWKHSLQTLGVNESWIHSNCFDSIICNLSHYKNFFTTTFLVRYLSCLEILKNKLNFGHLCLLRPSNYVQLSLFPYKLEELNCCTISLKKHA